MKHIQVVVAFDVYKEGDCVEVEPQVACDAIAQGYAVPYTHELPREEFDPVEENRAIDGAPEVK
jgi:hypothetical protein